MDIDFFCRKLIRDAQSQFRKITMLKVHGGLLPVRVLQVPSDTSKRVPLVVTFHGVLSERSTYPMFYGTRFIGKASQRLLIAIADPTLAGVSDLRFGWYSGYQGFDVPAAISEFLSSLMTAVKPSRTIFVGGSIGAHAALRYTKQFTESVAVLANPLTKISAYYPPAVKRYFETCWPGDYDEDLLISERVMDDAGALFDDGSLTSTIVIIQNATDHHIGRQALPLLARLGRDRESISRLLPIISFFPDAIGHKMDASEFSRCVEAAIIAPSTDAVSIGLAREELSKTGDAVERKTHSINSRDLALAQKLAEQLGY